MDWITGNKFKLLTKIHYAPPRGTGRETHNVFDINDYRYLENTMDVNSLKSDDLIYTHTFYVKGLFDIISKLEYKQLRVITHNCDTNVDFVPPDNVTRWYTTNVNIRYPSIQSIPIGLENDIWGFEKKEKMIQKLKEPKQIRNLVYMNHNIANNPAKRQRPYDALRDKGWVTTEMSANGLGFDSYLDGIYNHKFVVCPEGNGIDTHRIWECLYMGSIPIMENNINSSFYGDLPILTVNNWEDITEEKLLLANVAINIQDQHAEMLTFEYWKNKINGFSDSIIGN